MNGIPLWCAIFVFGLSVGLLWAKTDQAKNDPVEPFAASTEQQVSARTQTTTPFQPASEVESDLPDVASLLERLIALENRVAELENAPIDEHRQIDRRMPGDVGDVPETRDQQALALSQAGFADFEVEQILQLHHQHQLSRLELRDRATREGWRDTADYRVALREVGDRAAEVRRELSDDAQFDQYLYAVGLSNRVMLQSTIPQGEAELAGLQSGDVIATYAGRRVFRMRELQQATTAGERGEMVPIEIERDGDRFEVYVPRGPLGVTIVGSRQSPGE